MLGDDARFGCLQDPVNLVREPSDAVLVSWTRRLHADDGVVVVVEAEDGDALAMTDRIRSVGSIWIDGDYRMHLSGMVFQKLGDKDCFGQSLMSHQKTQ